MNTQNTITVQTTINAPLQTVWDLWTKPEHIGNWAFASEDWEAPRAENDVRVGGKFVTVMSAKDKSASFDFNGVYTDVKNLELIEYDMEPEADGTIRHVKVEFAESPEGIQVIETFDAERLNSEELQRNGWQSILENFKKYVERQPNA